MLVAFTTLLFLVTGWAAATAILAVVDECGGKMLAALKGESLLSREAPAMQVPLRVSARWAPRPQPVRARPVWRAAA